MIPFLLTALGGCDGDEGSARTSVRVEQGVVGELVGGDDTGLMTARGLFGFTGELAAVRPDGSAAWVVALPGGVADVMRADDGTIYASLFDRVVAVDPAGRLLPFDGAAGGQLAMHPSGRPMVFGDGFTVLDHDGYPFLTALAGTTVHAAAVDTDGRILALVTHVPEGGDPEVVRIYAYSERFEPIWWADIDPPGGGGGDLAVSEDFIAISYGTTTEARAADGAPLWRVNNAGGALLVGPDDTTYLQGVNEAAVTRAGEVLWSTARGARFVLTDRGLGAIWKGADRFGSESTVVGFIDPATGEVLESTTFPPLTDFVAPAVIGGRLVAAGHVVNTSQSFNPGGDIVVSQDAERAFFTGSAAGLADGWATAGGPGSTRSGPVAARMPTGDDLMGFWVARDGDRVRILQFAAQSFAFNLFGGRVYGIWDHDTRERPRLVQVGLFSVSDDVVTLAPVSDLATGARTSLRLYTSPPGGLRIDDPLQDVTRTFARAGRVPPASAPGYTPPAPTALIAEEGPSDRNTVRLVAEAPGSDDLWVVSEYDYQGKLGGRQYLGSNIRVNGNNVTGNLFNAVVARITPEGETVASWHIDTPLTMVPRAILPEGEADLRVIGPVPIGDTNPTLASSVLLSPSGDALEPVAIAPWPPEDAAGRAFDSRATAVIPESGGAAAHGGRRDRTPANPGEDYRAVVLRLGPTGEVIWETTLEAAEGSATPFQVHAVGATATHVFALATIDAPIATQEGPLSNLGLTRAVLLRLDATTGAIERAVGLGEGGLTGAVMRARPDGGVVVVGRPTGRFATEAGAAPQDGRTHVIAAFSRELEALFTHTFTAGSGGGTAWPVDVVVDPDGWTLIAGRSSGNLVLGDAAFGGQNRATPLVELTPCGDLARPRTFGGRIELNAIALAQDGSLIAGGGFMSDIYEPPFYAAFKGKIPTPSSPTGGTNNLLMRLERGERGGDWSPFCSASAVAPVRLELALSGSGHGRVRSDPPGIDCPGTCTATFAPLTRVRLDAVPEETSSFTGFSEAPFAASDCATGTTCTLTLGTDLAVRAHFDAARLAHVLPLESMEQPYVIAARGERVALGSRGGVLIAEGGETIANIPFEGQGRVTSIAIAEDGRVVVGLTGAFARVYAEGGSQDRAGVLVADAEGEVLWARALPSPGTSHVSTVAVRGGDVAVVWEASAPIEVDGVAIDAGPVAVARFDGETGDLIAAIGLSERPTAVGVDRDERVFVQGGGELDGGGGVDLAPGIAIAPGPSGRWFVRWEAPFETPAAWRWPAWRLDWLPTLFPADGAGSSVIEVFVDAALRPRFAAMTDGVASPATQDAERLVIANLPPAFFGLEGAGPARASFQAIGPGARPEAAWVTPAGDDVTVLALAAAPDSALVAAVVTARTLRDAEYTPLFTAPTENAVPALVFVLLEEARR